MWWRPTATYPLPKVLLAIVTVMVLVACRQSAERESVASPVIIVPTSLPETPTSSPTLTAQPTATPTPRPTVPIEPTPTICPNQYFFSPSPPSCPAGEALASFAAEQPFERGVMVWFEATASIYVFYKDGHWQRFDDNWSEDQAQSDPTFIPPAERFQPIRGFGKVWRENLDVREQLGWALGVELAFDSMMQGQAEEIANPGVLFIGTFNGQVFALTNPDQDEGDWVIAAS